MSTPITESKVITSEDVHKEQEIVLADDMRALELAANGLAERLRLRSDPESKELKWARERGWKETNNPRWVERVEADAKALLAYAALQPKEPHE